MDKTATPAGTDLAKEFRTHSNYVRAFAELAGLGLGSDAFQVGLATIPEKIDQFLSEPPPAKRTDLGVDLQQIGRSLRAAWGTTLLLKEQQRLVGQVPEIAGVAATWAVIQSYYACYHSAQALAVAEGNSRPPEHPKTQAGFVSSWANRTGVCAPWTLAHDHEGLKGAGVDSLPEVSNLATCTPGTRLPLVALALRTTWNGLLEARLAAKRDEKKRAKRREWNEAEAERQSKGLTSRVQPSWWGRRPQLTSDEKSGVAHRQRPAGLMHYLYRLRIQANYLDADRFTEGPTTDWEAHLFLRDLSYVAAATVAANARRVEHRIGSEGFLRLETNWAETSAPNGLSQLG